METLGKITLFCIMIVGAFLTALLGAKIILSIAVLYNLSFIANMSFVQVYGFTSIVAMLKYKYKKSEDKKRKFLETIEESFSAVFGTLLWYLIGWGVSYLAYYILC